MDPFIHTLIAVGSLLCAYYLGRHLGAGKNIDKIICQILDKLERDGFIVVKEDKDSGEKELIPISEIIVRTLKEAKKEW